MRLTHPGRSLAWLVPAMLPLLAGWSVAQGPTVGVTVTNDDQNSSSTFEVAVSGLPQNQKWKDLHFFTNVVGKFPRLTGSTNVVITNKTTGQPAQTWKRTSSSNARRMVAVYADNESGLGDGTYEFTLDWKASDYNKAKELSVVWVATDDGDDTTYSDLEGEDSIDDSSGEAAPNLPTLTVMLNDGRDKTLAYGTTWADIAVTVNKGWQGSSYEVYTSTVLVEDYSDQLGIGIASQTDPVPASWFVPSNFTGTIDSEGSADPLPSLVMDDDPDLAGNVFYMVLAIQDGGTIELFSDPITVEITAP